MQNLGTPRTELGHPGGEYSILGDAREKKNLQIRFHQKRAMKGGRKLRGSGTSPRVQGELGVGLVAPVCRESIKSASLP